MLGLYMREGALVPSTLELAVRQFLSILFSKKDKTAEPKQLQTCKEKVELSITTKCMFLMNRRCKNKKTKTNNENNN